VLRLYREGDAAADTRFEHGVAEGDEISPHYDPMLAKVVRWAPSRPAALAGLARTLAGMAIGGVATNRDTLVATLRHPEVVAGRTFTRFYDDHPDVVAARPDPAIERVAALAATLDRERTNRAADRRWDFAPSGWRTVPTGRREVSWRLADDREVTVEYLMAPDERFTATVRSHSTDSSTVGGTTDDGIGDVATEAAGRVLARVDVEGGSRVTVEVDGVGHTIDVHCEGDGSDRRWCCGPGGQVELRERSRFPTHSADLVGGGPTAPVPGTVTSVEVAAGDEVAGGQVLVVMEAMKMEHAVVAGTAGRLTHLHVAAGDQVDADAVLAIVEPADA
jgi:propionyl-CoA carboxylase alpha chain